MRLLAFIGSFVLAGLVLALPDHPSQLPVSHTDTTYQAGFMAGRRYMQNVAIQQGLGELYYDPETDLDRFRWVLPEKAVPRGGSDLIVASPPESGGVPTGR